MDLNVVQWVHVAGMIGANGFLGPSTEEQLSWAVLVFTDSTIIQMRRIDQLSRAN